MQARRQADEIGLVVGAVTVVDTDGKAARDLARREAALYLPIIATLDHSLAIEPELLTRLKEATDAYDFERAGSYISDDLLQRLAFAGTPDQVASQAAQPCSRPAPAGSSLAPPTVSQPHRAYAYWASGCYRNCESMLMGTEGLFYTTKCQNGVFPLIGRTLYSNFGRQYRSFLCDQFRQPFSHYLRHLECVLLTSDTSCCHSYHKAGRKRHSTSDPTLQLPHRNS